MQRSAPSPQAGPAAPSAGLVDLSYDPRTGQVGGSIPHSSADDVEAAVRTATAATATLATRSPAIRQAWLEAVATGLEQHVEELVELGEQETALGPERLRGEVARMAGQLRFYGAVAAEGSYLDATLETTPMGPLARLNVALGPVAVFGASNFPFGFGVLGNDTASAIAAGCPVLVKAHPAHPRLSLRLYEVAVEALEQTGAPAGTLTLLVGFEAGTALVRHRGVRAVAFTGSQRGGMALRALAEARDEVIPVYAEMGTVNPAVATPGADLAGVASGFVTSFTLGSGQFCTKPGLLLAPRGATEAVAAALADAAPAPVMLTEAIAGAVGTGVQQLVAAGATVRADTPTDRPGWSAPAVLLSADLADLKPGSRLLEETFGAVAIVAEYDQLTDALSTLDRMQGALAGCVLTGGADDPDTAAVIERLQAKVGRVILDGWPTGVAVAWAQQHGGPWPSTTDPRTTSVGSAALGRFVRPLAFQGAGDPLLPPALRSDNPWRLPRRVDGVLQAAPRPEVAP